MGFDLEVLPTAALAAQAAARRFVAAANDAIRARGQFVVALSGGSDPPRMYAPLFPSAVAVHDSPCWVRAEYVQAVSAWRVTLTPITFNAAAEVAFLVTGVAKAPILRQVLEGPWRPYQLPAQLIAPTAGRVRWFVDAPAAAALRRDTAR